MLCRVGLLVARFGINAMQGVMCESVQDDARVGLVGLLLQEMLVLLSCCWMLLADFEKMQVPSVVLAADRFLFLEEKCQSVVTCF